MVSLTNGLGTEHWIEVTKDWRISAYVPGNILNNLTRGLASTKPNKQEAFTSKEPERY